MRKVLSLSVLAVLCSVSAVGAAPLYSTTLNFNAVRSSDYAATGSGFQTFDNFRLDSFSGLVEEVSWDFFSVDLANPGNATPPASDVTQWVLTFYADAAGVPGSELATQTLQAPDVAASSLGLLNFITTETYRVEAFRYTASLTLPFHADQGTIYWLSVLGLSATFDPVAVWMGGSGGIGGSSYQNILGPGRAVVSGKIENGDRSFGLNGRVVPEPTMLLLMASGLGAVVLRRRKA